MLSERFQEPCQFHLFYETERMQQFFDHQCAKYLLIDQENVKEIRRLDKDGSIWGEISERSEHIFFLTEHAGLLGNAHDIGSREDQDSGPRGSETDLFKYQPVDQIIRLIIGYQGDIDKSSLSHPMREKTAVKTKTRANRIRAEPVTRGLIGVYSPVHRIGKTRFALKMGRKLAEEAHVLYLNLEGYSGNEYYFPEKKDKSLADLLYFMRQEKTNLGVKISAMAGQSGKMDYVMPIENEYDLRNIGKDDWINMIDMIFEKCIYEVIILDLGDCIDGLYDILKKCDKVYTLYLEEGAAMAKINQYEQTLITSGYEEILKKTVKKRVGKTKHTEDR